MALCEQCGKNNWENQVDCEFCGSPLHISPIDQNIHLQSETIKCLQCGKTVAIGTFCQHCGIAHGVSLPAKTIPLPKQTIAICGWLAPSFGIVLLFAYGRPFIGSIILVPLFILLVIVGITCSIKTLPYTKYGKRFKVQAIVGVFANLILVLGICITLFLLLIILSVAGT